MASSILKAYTSNYYHNRCFSSACNTSYTGSLLQTYLGSLSVDPEELQIYRGSNDNLEYNSLQRTLKACCEEVFVFYSTPFFRGFTAVFQWTLMSSSLQCPCRLQFITIHLFYFQCHLLLHNAAFLTSPLVLTHALPSLQQTLSSLRPCLTAPDSKLTLRAETKLHSDTLKYMMYILLLEVFII